MRQLKFWFVFGWLVFPGWDVQAAGILIEPIVGWDLGQFSAVTQVGDTTVMTLKAAASGLGLGGRLGWANDEFFSAADFRWSSLDMATRLDGSAVTTDANLSHLRIGVAAGAPIPIILSRFVATIHFYDELRGDSTTTPKGIAVGGGLGFNPISFVSANAEFFYHFYNSRIVDTATTRRTQWDLLFSLSFPVTIPITGSSSSSRRGSGGKISF